MAKDERMSTDTVTRAEEAYRVLRQAIIMRELPQGAWLRQRTVAAQLGMSPTPLVQAFQRLEREGLVECVPQWGVRVRALTVGELRQIYGMRMALESMVFRELASRIDEVADAIRNLCPLAEEVDRADELLRVEILEGRRKLGASLLIDQKFHLALAELSGMDLVKREIDRLCLLPATILALVPKAVPTTTTHVDLLNAIQTGNPDTAEQAIRKAIHATASHALTTLQEQFGDGPIIYPEKKS
jgi:DNA-binding GntR family transcriptional regulator